MVCNYPLFRCVAEQEGGTFHVVQRVAVHILIFSPSPFVLRRLKQIDIEFMKQLHEKVTSPLQDLGNSLLSQHVYNSSISFRHASTKEETNIGCRILAEQE